MIFRWDNMYKKQDILAIGKISKAWYFYSLMFFFKMVYLTYFQQYLRSLKGLDRKTVLMAVQRYRAVLQLAYLYLFMVKFN